MKPRIQEKSIDERLQDFKKILEYVLFQLNGVDSVTMLARNFGMHKTKKFRKALDDDISKLFKISRILSNPKADAE